MKVEGNSTQFVLFINNANNKYLLESKESIGSDIKDIFIKIFKYYNLSVKGIYDLNIYHNEKLGLVIEGFRKDDYDFSNIIDLRLNIIRDYEFLFKSDDYFKLNNYKNIFYYQGNYYVSINDVDNIYDIIEYIDIIFGNKKKQIYNKLVALK